MTLRLPRYWLAALPLGALLVAETLRSILFQIGLGCNRAASLLPGTCNSTQLRLASAPRNPALRLEALPARIAWHGVAVATALAAAAALALAVWILHTWFRRLKLPDRVLLWAGLAGVTVLVCLNAYVHAQSFVLVKDLLSPSAGIYTPSLATYLLAVAGIVRTITFAPLVPVVTAVGVLMVAAATPATPAGLAQSSAQLRYLLYSSATLLVLGVLELHTFLSWLTSDIPPPAGPLLTQSTEAAAATSGAVYAAYLALIFLPPAILLSARAHSLARSAQPEASPSEEKTWLEARGLQPRWHTIAINTVAVLSPLLIGSPLAKLVDLLKGM